MISINVLDVAKFYVGMKEKLGNEDNPQIQAWLNMAGLPEGSHDEVAWCGAFMCGVLKPLGIKVPTNPAHARNWSIVGNDVSILDAKPGDVVVLRRGSNPSLGHVGFFTSYDQHSHMVGLLSGNHHNEVGFGFYNDRDVIAVRRVQ